MPRASKSSAASPFGGFWQARRRGAVIILVLGIIAIVTALLFAFSEEALRRLSTRALYEQRDTARQTAYSALEVVLARLAELREVDGSLWGPAQGWPTTLTDIPWPPGETPTVSIVDESGRFSLRQATPELLMAFFDEFRVSVSLSSIFVDSLLDWQDDDDLERLNGAERDTYERETPPYAPPNAVLQSWAEIPLIRGAQEIFFDDETGAPTELYTAFRDTFTLRHQGTAVNLNTASAGALRLLERLEGISADALGLFKGGADGEPGTEDDRVLRNTQEIIPLRTGGGSGTGAAVVEAQTLLVEIAVPRGEGAFRLAVLVTPAGSGGGGGRGGDGSRPNPTPDPNPAPPPPPNVSPGRGERAPGGATTAPAGTTPLRTGADLRYPFAIQQLVENAEL